MKQRILLASGNAKKLAELRALCAELPVEILSPADLPGGLPDVVEDGATFEANARKKALAAAAVAAELLGADVWALADDSGLCVDALNGAPGVFSARFAQLDGTFAAAAGAAAAGAAGAAAGTGNSVDGANNRRLLRELEGVPAEKRGGAFHCALVVARTVDGQSEVLFGVEGSVRGRLLEEADGTLGFGYDPLFWHEPSGTTFARLSGDEKALVSHRGEAIRKLRAVLLNAL